MQRCEEDATHDDEELGMTSGFRTFIYPVKDLAKAKALYGRLSGVKPDMDALYYVGFTVDGQHIDLDPHGHSQGTTGPVSYWHVDDIRKRLKALGAAGRQGCGRGQADCDSGGCGRQRHRPAPANVR